MSEEEEFVAGPDGVVRWGLYGAAGLLLRHTDAHGVTRYLLAERGPYVQHPGTWAYPGGALRRGETPEAGAVREFVEEFGSVPAYTVAEVIVDQPVGAGGWFYATVVADVTQMGHLSVPLTMENTGRICWATAAEMAQLPLHPGLQASLTRVSGVDNCGHLTNWSAVPPAAHGFAKVVHDGR